MPIVHVPVSPVPEAYRPPYSSQFKVGTGMTLASIANLHGMTWKELVEYNWKTTSSEELNWYLKERVGCTHVTSDDKYYVLHDDDNPGNIYVPKNPPTSHNVDVPTVAGAHGTISRKRRKIRTAKIPLGSGNTFMTINVMGSIGKIYIPSKFGGVFTIKTDTGTVKLCFKNGGELDDGTILEIITGSHGVAAPGSQVTYNVPAGKHGWYFALVKSASDATVKNSFIQEGEAHDIPWNGWFCPTKLSADASNPNLYSDFPGFAPLKKYDDRFGTATRTWEESHHTGTLGWEGHCWGWSLAAVAKKGIHLPAGFTEWEMKALYSELADNATGGWQWKIGAPAASIPSGPVEDSLAPSKTLNAYVKVFHDGIYKWIGTDRRAMNADLRGDAVVLEWLKNSAGVEQKINGVTLISANSQSGFWVELRWDPAASTLKWHDGNAVPVSADDNYELKSTFGRLFVYVKKSQLPAAVATGKIYLSTEIWNYSIYRFTAELKEYLPWMDEQYIQIKIRITGNVDVPFPPGNSSTVTRTYIYRLKYDASGATTATNANWIDCGGYLPPACLGIVNGEGSFNWHANCGITKHNVDTL